MLWFYEHLDLFVFGLFASGITLHFVVRRMERQRYLVLRNAYEDAVRDSRESDGDPAAVVREAELHRAFMNSWLPGWFHGFGGCVVAVLPRRQVDAVRAGLSNHEGTKIPREATRSG